MKKPVTPDTPKRKKDHIQNKKKVDNAMQHKTYPINKDLIHKLMSERFKIDMFNYGKQDKSKLQFSTTENMQPKVDHIKRKLLDLNAISNKNDSCCPDHKKKMVNYMNERRKLLLNKKFAHLRAHLQQQENESEQTHKQKTDKRNCALKSGALTLGLTLANCIDNPDIIKKLKGKDDGKSYLTSTLVQRAINDYMAVKHKESMYSTEFEREMEIAADDLYKISNTLGSDQSMPVWNKNLNDHHIGLIDDNEMTDDHKKFQNRMNSNQPRAFLDMMYIKNAIFKNMNSPKKKKRQRFESDLDDTELINNSKSIEFPKSRLLKTEPDVLIHQELQQNKSAQNFPKLKLKEKYDLYESKQSLVKNNSESILKNKSFRISLDKRSTFTKTLDESKQLNNFQKINKNTATKKVSEIKVNNSSLNSPQNNLTSMSKSVKFSEADEKSNPFFTKRDIYKTKVQNEDIHHKLVQLSKKSKDGYFKSRKMEEINFSNNETRENYYNCANDFSKFFDKYNELFPENIENELSNSNAFSKNDLLKTNKSLDKLEDGSTDNIRTTYDHYNNVSTEANLLQDFKDIKRKITCLEASRRGTELVSTMNDYFENYRDMEDDLENSQEMTKYKNNDASRSKISKLQSERNELFQTLQYCGCIDQNKLDELSQQNMSFSNLKNKVLKLMNHDEDVIRTKAYIRDLQTTQIENNAKLFNIKDKFKVINDKIVQSELKRVNINEKVKREQTLKKLNEKINPLRISSTTRSLKFRKHIDNPDPYDKYVYDDHFRPEFIKTKRF